MYTIILESIGIGIPGPYNKMRLKEVGNRNFIELGNTY